MPAGHFNYKRTPWRANFDLGARHHGLTPYVPPEAEPTTAEELADRLLEEDPGLAVYQFFENVDARELALESAAQLLETQRAGAGSLPNTTVDANRG